MNSEIEIKARNHLASLGIEAESIFFDAMTQSLRIVLSDGLIFSKKHRLFSDKAIDALAEKLQEECGFPVVVALTTSVRDAIEVGIESALGISHPNIFSGVGIQFSSESDVRVELSGNIDSELISDVRSKVERILSAFSLQIVELVVSRVGGRDIRSKDVLQLLRVHSPMRENTLIFKLSRIPGLTVDKRSIKNKLDGLRKDGLIVWRPDDSYVLTELGVAAIPGSNEGSSFDVRRVLALAKRNW